MFCLSYLFIHEKNFIIFCDFTHKHLFFVPKQRFFSQNSRVITQNKLFTDYLDDISGEYADGNMRGNPRTKDWYFFYGATLTMRLPKPNRPCHGLGFN